MYGHRSISTAPECLASDPVRIDLQEVIAATAAAGGEAELIDPETGEVIEDDDRTPEDRPQQAPRGKPKPRGRPASNTFEMVAPGRVPVRQTTTEEVLLPRLRVTGDVTMEAGGLYAYAMRHLDFRGTILEFMEGCTVAYFELLRRRLAVVDYSGVADQPEGAEGVV